VTPAAGRPAAGPALRNLPLLLTAVLLVVAVGVSVAGAVSAPAADGLPIRLAVVAGLVALAQLARLRPRRGAAAVAFTWGEAALIIGLYVLPAGWLPAAAFVGAAVGWLLLTAAGDRRSLAEIGHAAAALTVGFAAGAAVSAALGASAGTAPTPSAALAAVLGAGAYFLVTGVLAALTLTLHGDGRFGPLLLRTAAAKLPMVAGNVVVGLAAVLVVAAEPGWLVLAAPLLWLLHRAYAQQLRADDERRTWEMFSRAAQELAQGSERDVAAAGLRGVHELFEAERAELDVADPDGRHRRYAVDSSGELVESTLHRPLRRPPGATASRDLAVRGDTVGQLSMWLPRQRTASPREQLALSAYAEAVGAALHDAATGARLGVVRAQAAYEATHDALTGLANRAALLADGSRLLHGLDRAQPVALLLFDLNDFKSVNGTLGHCAGDELLRVTAQRLTDLARDGEILARLGDDEFALLMPDVPVLSDSAALHEPGVPLAQALRRARIIVEQLRSPARVAGVRLVVESSVGVVVTVAGEADIAELVRRGEVAMEQVKATGGGIAGYDSGADTASTDHLALLAELREALAADDQIILELQPEVDLGTGAATGVEALARWRHPRRGLLHPAAFIREVEHSELLGDFTRHVLNRSVATAAAWVAAGIDIPVSVNLSARNLLDAGLPAQIADALRRHRLPAHRLVLEITETVAVSEQPIVDEVLRELRSLGVQLSVDDFGTGFSSLAFLARADVDELKIDRTFVGRMIDSPAAAAIVRSTVELGRGLGLRVVAEGVETAAQRAALVELGCTAAQGYHFSRPLPVDKIGAALRDLGQGPAAKVVPLRADDAG
jgi:diguanylate cyclase (GGDEF)-like protein